MNKNKRKIKWGKIVLFLLIGFLVAGYLWLGQLRFFVNNAIPLGFIHKNYLVLFQNNYELRPGGGFITAFTEASTTLGIPTKLKVSDSYEISPESYTTPPYPQEELLGSEFYEGYSFRDANWNPDFQTSVNDLVGFYNQSNPDQNIHGIVVVNFSVIEDFVDSLGGITIDGKTFTKENLFSELEFEVNNVDRHNVEEVASRKGILNTLSKKIVIKSIIHPFKTKKTLIKELDSKNIYFWLKKPSLQKKIVKRNWGNTLQPTENENFFGTNLANLGAKKTDRYLLQDVHYFIDISKVKPTITVEVTLRYPDQANTYSTTYSGYLRLLIPKTAEIISMPQESTPQTQAYFKEVGTIVNVNPETKNTYTYSYQLPENFNTNPFNLDLIKQSGTSVNYNVFVEASNGQILSSNDFIAKENQAVYFTRLNNDKSLQLTVNEDELPPFALDQFFTAPTEVVINFSEKLNLEDANNPENYSLIDLDKNHPETTDTIEIIEAEAINISDVKLTITGATLQEEEYYQLQIKNLKDTSLNTIDPNPRNLIIVQRLEESFGSN